MAPQPPRVAPSMLRADEDGREMCFSQGKPCVYESESDPNVIITEWPNGVIEKLNVPSMTVTRTWPNGSTETFPENSAENERYPHIPEADGRCRNSRS